MKQEVLSIRFDAGLSADVVFPNSYPQVIPRLSSGCEQLHFLGTGQKHRILVYDQRRREGVLGGPKLYVQSMFCRPEEDTPSPKRSVKQADRSHFLRSSRAVDVLHLRPHGETNCDLRDEVPRE